MVPITDIIIVQDLCSCIIFAVCHYIVLTLLQKHTLLQHHGGEMATKARTFSAICYDSDSALEKDMERIHTDGSTVSTHGVDQTNTDVEDLDVTDDEEDHDVKSGFVQQGPCRSAGILLLEQYGVLDVPAGYWDASNPVKEPPGRRDLLEFYCVLGAPLGAWGGGGV